MQPYLGKAVDEAISQAAGAQGSKCNDTSTNNGEQNNASTKNKEGDDIDTRNDADAEEDESAKDCTEQGNNADNEEIAYKTVCRHHIWNVW